MTISLYPDQQELFDSLRSTMAVSKHVLLQLATGGGKTVLAAAMIHGTRNKGTTAMMVVPRRELLRQTARTFTDYEIPFSYCAAGYQMNPLAKTFLATSGTLLQRIRAGTAPAVNLLTIDETHIGGAGLDEIIEYYKALGAWVVGLSATPARLDGKGLDRWYNSMVCGKSVDWLIKNKRLSEYLLFACEQPDLSKIRKVAGDYARGELSSYMESQTYLIGNAVNHYKKNAMGKLNIAYCTSIKHSEIVCQNFRDAGVPAAHIDGKTSDEDRVKIIRAFARREILTLTSCDLLLYGFDLAAQSGLDVTVESMSDLRPTESLALQLQKYGRVLRKKDYPALIFDHAGNAVSAKGVIKHGWPDDDREWTLKGYDKKAGSGGRASPVVQCKECYFAYRPAARCPFCGHTPIVATRLPSERAGELEVVTRDSLKPIELTPEQIQKRDELAKKLEAAAIRTGINRFAAKKWAMKKAMQQIGAA